ncbi:MAG TPA: hypothetical protein VM580_12190 [Labilithrix sp.]|jgi:hypothetical protein|nr:hypothetical protein [Labilithrix sp.]
MIPEWALSGAVAVAVIAVMVWQDTVKECNDGRRYTSGKPQPTPFHRRWCGWPKWLLIASSYAGLVFVSATLGSWWQSLLFITLPGVWFCATRPTTVDAPAMALAWGSAMLFPKYPYFAVLLSCLAGFVHERGPVFAALYVWSPLPLIGLVACGWWRTAAPHDGDPYVGLPSFRATVAAHRKMQDWLSWGGYVVSTRGLIPIAALVGVPLSAWAALAVAHASRLVATDNSRIVLWGAPPMIAAMHDVPHWAVAAHVLTFVRMF